MSDMTPTFRLTDDILPKLAADLDTNAFNILFDTLKGILDDSSNEQLLFQKIASAVNYFQMTNAATGNGVNLAALGSDTNIDLLLTPKGTGSLITTAKLLGGQLQLAAFTALDNEPPSANYATLDTRNGHTCLDFDDTVDESAIFRGKLPNNYNGGGLTIEIVWAATTATSGDCSWNASIERCNTDLDSDSFAAANATNSVTNGTSGITTITIITFTDGADMDSLAAGEMFRLKITRDASVDISGDVELFSVSIRET